MAYIFEVTWCGIKQCGAATRRGHPAPVNFCPIDGVAPTSEKCGATSWDSMQNLLPTPCPAGDSLNEIISGVRTRETRGIPWPISNESNVKTPMLHSTHKENLRCLRCLDAAVGWICDRSRPPKHGRHREAMLDHVMHPACILQNLRTTRGREDVTNT